MYNSTTVFQSGNVDATVSVTNAFYGRTTDSNVLIITGGHMVASAPDTYTKLVNDKETTYNIRSHALFFMGGDGYWNYGTVELRAGTYCVVGEFNVWDSANSVILFSDNYDGSGSYASNESDVEESENDLPKWVLVVENGVYLGGVLVRDGEYYVNGENGGAGRVASIEPKEWNAKVEVGYDAENDKLYYVVTLNGLHIASQENSLFPAAIFANAEIRFVDLGEKANIVQASVANPLFVSAIPGAAVVTLHYEVGGEDVLASDGNVKEYIVSFVDGTQVPTISQQPTDDSENNPTDAPNANPDNNPTDETDNGSLSAGGIAAISVGSTLAATCGGFSLFWFVIKKKKFSDLVAAFRK